MEKPPQYRVYLLRCWQERSQKERSRSSWRFALEDPETRQRHGFPDLNSLTTFLQASIDGASEDAEHEPEE
ncbi:MAG: hypothetical protein WCG26_00310 [Chloroflexales bacterium]